MHRPEPEIIKKPPDFSISSMLLFCMICLVVYFVVLFRNRNSGKQYVFSIKFLEVRKKSLFIMDCRVPKRYKK